MLPKVRVPEKVGEFIEYFFSVLEDRGRFEDKYGIESWLPMTKRERCNKQKK